MKDHAKAIEHLRALTAARRLHIRAFVMTEPRTTAQYDTEELMALIATSACNDRITARMPAVTLDELLRREPPAYARGGTALPLPKFPRAAVIAISCALTVIMALGLAAAI
jgi:hypothetical protein